MPQQAESSDGKSLVLEAFNQALSRETYNLSERPDLLWQQLHNRLQWGKEMLRENLEPERELRNTPGARPWLRTRTPFRESEALLRVLKGHAGVVYACAVSPDGSWIASASRDRTLKVWETATGRERRTLAGHAESVNDCAFSPDGSRILSAGADGLKLWHVESGQELRTFQGERADACAVSPDGSWIVSASGRTLNVWTAGSGEELHRMANCHYEGIMDCAISPDGAGIVSAGMDGSLKLWDAATGNERRTVTGHGDRDRYGAIAAGSGWIFGCAFSPDGSWIVSASRDKTLGLWHVESGEFRVLEGHRDAVRSCAVSPDGSLIASASDDGTLRLWDAASGNEVRSLTGHTARDYERTGLKLSSVTVFDCAFAPDGSWIVSAGFDETLKMWQTQTEEGLRTDKDHSDWVNACAFSPNGSFVVSASDDTTVRVWDASSGEGLRTLRGHAKGVRSCAVSPDASFVVSASADKTLRVWDAASGKQLRTLRGHEGDVDGCAVSPDGSWIVSAGSDRTVRLWDAASGKQLRTLQVHGAFGSAGCAVSPDGSFIVSAGGGGTTLSVWDAANGEQVCTLEAAAAGGWVQDCAVSPDGSFVVSASDRVLKLWDTRRWKQLSTLRGHPGRVGYRGRVEGCAVSPDGAFIISAGGDSTLRVWDAVHGDELATLPLLGGGLSAALHPWLPLAVCGDGAGAVYLTDLVGIEYGPIIVTPVDFGSGATIRCPACLEHLALEEGWLGEEIRCSREACAWRMRVNPFVVERPQRGRRLAFWRRK